MTVHPGTFRTSQITVLLGENGTGKTTFIKMLAEAGKKKEGISAEEKEKIKDVLIFLNLDSTNEY